MLQHKETKTKKPSILAGASKLLQQYLQILPEGKYFSGPHSAQHECTGRAMFLNNTSSERQTEKKHIQRNVKKKKKIT